MATALDRVMDQAQASADAQVPATIPQNTGGAVATQQAPMRPSLDSQADAAGIQVDAYLTIKDTGFRLGDAKSKLFTELEGTIDLLEVSPIVSVRATNAAGATTFIKSYDGVMTNTGQNFQVAINQLAATHSKVDGPYQTTEIPVVLTKALDGYEVGSTIGITPSITGAKQWGFFYRQLREKNLQRSKVKVKITHLYQTNKSGNEWGVPVFELLGEADD